MSQLIRKLIDQLRTNEVRFCHWKSNAYLEEALSGSDDLDLLVDPTHIHQFEQILSSLGFKKGVDPLQSPMPSVFHFYGMDKNLETLVHLHVYYRIITGESMIKNYCFPLEQMVLENGTYYQEVPIPSKEAELIIATLRIMMKHTSLPELLLMRQSYGDMRSELTALYRAASIDSCKQLINHWVPPLDFRLLERCIRSVTSGSILLVRIILALRLRAALRPYGRYTAIQESLYRIQSFANRIHHRLRGKGKSKRMANKGILVAFVGPEAVGKSTLVHETCQWLGKTFNVTSGHLGKPPSSWVTYLPNRMLPYLRKKAANSRSSRIEAAQNDVTQRFSVLYAIRSIMIAWDRRRFAINLRREAVNGQLVICDRYPSPVVGAMDSAKLVAPEGRGLSKFILRRLARWENRLYRDIPPPDLIIQLTVPIEVAIERNRKRVKLDKESDDYVTRRHKSKFPPSFPCTEVIAVDSSRELTDTTQAIREIVWSRL